MDLIRSQVADPNLEYTLCIPEYIDIWCKRRKEPRLFWGDISTPVFGMPEVYGFSLELVQCARNRLGLDSNDMTLWNYIYTAEWWEMFNSLPGCRPFVSRYYAEPLTPESLRSQPSWGEQQVDPVTGQYHEDAFMPTLVHEEELHVLPPSYGFVTSLKPMEMLERYANPPTHLDIV